MRPTLQEFKKKALADPEVCREYHELAPAYRLSKQEMASRLSQKKGISIETHKR